MQRLGVLLLLGVVLSGCAATSQRSDVNKLQVKIAQLEQKLYEREQEIADLKYEIRDLSVQMDDTNTQYPVIEPIETYRTSYIEPEPAAPVIQAVSGKDKDDIIRVPVSAQRIQNALQRAGYYKGAIDGKIGKKSKGAIIAFQKDHGLKADGIIGRQTWAQLQEYLE